MQVGETFIKVRPDTRGFAGEMRSDVQRAGTGVGQDLGRTISAGLAGVLAGGAAVGFLRDSVGAASDLNEAVSLTGVTFQGAADSVLAMGETSAESLGLANSEALNFANSIGGLFIGFGETRAEAAAMAEDVVTLGADLASAKNLSGGTAEALEILRSGLVGEVEPLRRIGVALNAASVEQRALADTGKESAAALTEGEKAAARYALIFESLSSQGIVGDFERTAGGAANQQRILSAEFKNAQAELGQKLLPAFISLIGAVRDGIPLLSLVGDHLSAGAEGASILAAALAPLVSLTEDVNEGFENLTGGSLNLTSLAGPLGQLTTIVEAFQNAVRQGVDFGGFSLGTGGDLTSQVESTEEEIRAALERLDLEFGGDSTIGLQEWATAVGQFATDAGLSFADALAELNIRGELANSILNALGTQGAAAGAGLGQIGAELDAANNAAARGDLGETADALAAIAEEADNARQELEDLFGIQQSLDEANVALQESHDALVGSLFENGRAWDINTEAGRANLENARAAASAIREQTIAYRSNGASVDDAAASNEFLTQTLHDQLRAAGLSEQETNRLIETYGRVPRRILSTLDSNPQPAINGINEAVGYALGNWAGRVFTATLGVATGSVVGQIGAVEAQIDALSDNKSGPVDKNGGVTVNVYPQALISTEESLIRNIAPAVAGLVDEKNRRG